MIHLQPALRFNGGGHINHAIFWQVLSPKEGGNQPTGALADQIKKDFGSFDKMVTQLSNASVGVQGSGWGWLGFDKQGQRLQVATCSNQDPLQATTGKRERERETNSQLMIVRSGLIPIFGIDVWEHAYYLQYKNVRADYVKAIFQIANWKKADELFQKGKQWTEAIERLLFVFLLLRSAIRRRDKFLSKTKELHLFRIKTSKRHHQEATLLCVGGFFSRKKKDEGVNDS